MMYGDATIDAEVVSNFQGTTDSAAATKGAARQLFEAPKPKHASTDLKSADAEIASAFSRFMHLDFDDEAAEELLAGIKDRREAKTRRSLGPSRGPRVPRYEDDAGLIPCLSSNSFARYPSFLTASATPPAPQERSATYLVSPRVVIG